MNEFTQASYVIAFVSGIVAATCYCGETSIAQRFWIGVFVFWRYWLVGGGIATIANAWPTGITSIQELLRLFFAPIGNVMWSLSSFAIYSIFSGVVSVVFSRFSLLTRCTQSKSFNSTASARGIIIAIAGLVTILVCWKISMFYLPGQTWR
ncbi:hypothetical protein KOR42_45320 [Thalassoglobus neptunius]|uniref:Uncharacterized protein n=1 Tax=Thalassoglobus neptunius TaxID=1938619 RepID=A0A5C5VZZ6_9PLAN|nr:hypothetical protein KOR42_45320 [Thalassoglobus neptunius]